MKNYYIATKLELVKNICFTFHQKIPDHCQMLPFHLLNHVIVISALRTYIIDTWRKDEHLFVETDAYRFALEQCRTHKYITLTGVSGAGKSAMAYHIALQLEKEGYSILPVTSITEIKKYHDYSENQIFILDDPLGLSSFDTGKAEDMQSHSAAIDERFILGDSKIIFTSRTHVMQGNEICKSESVVKRNVIDLHNVRLKLSRDEKKKMFENHTHALDVDFDAADILTADHSNFPLLCKMYSCNVSFRKEGKAFFMDPFSAIIYNIKEFKSMSEEQYTALLLCAICDGCFDVEAFTEGLYEKQQRLIYSMLNTEYQFLPNIILEALNNLVNVYLVKEKENFRFIHEALFEAVVYHLGKDYGTDVFRRCSLEFIQKFMVVVKSRGECLTTNECDFLAERNIAELRAGNFLDVFLNPYFDEDPILLSFMKKLDALPAQEVTEIMLETTTSVNKQRIESLRKEHIWDRLVVLNVLLERGDVKAFHWVIALNFTLLFYYIFARFDEFPGRCNIGINCLSFLHAACFAGNTEIFAKLLRTGNAGSLKEQCAPLNTSALHLAVYSKNIHMAKWVIEGTCVPLIENQNIFDSTALFDAAAMDLGNMCAYLIEQCAEVNSLSKGGLTPLWIAAHEGNINVVQLLLANKADVNYADKDGATPLYIAAERGRKTVVQILLEHGAEINLCDKENVSPLYIAAQNGFSDIVKLLLQHNAKPNIQENNGESPLYIAARNGHEDVVEVLLVNKSSVNLCDKDGISPLNIACQNGHIETVKILLEHKAAVNQLDKQRVSPLYIAAQNGHVKVVEMLLANKDTKPDVNLADKNDVSPLYIACHNQHNETVAVLLQDGANVDQRTNDGATPLYIAAYRGDIDILNLLLQNNASVNISDNNSVSPLYMAAQNGHTPCLRLLLDNGAHVNATDSEGISPLLTAVQNGCRDAVTLLLKYGADVNKCDNDGNSPMDVATKRNLRAILKALSAKRK